MDRDCPLVEDLMARDMGSNCSERYQAFQMARTGKSKGYCSEMGSRCVLAARRPRMGEPKGLPFGAHRRGHVHPPETFLYGATPVSA